MAMTWNTLKGWADRSAIHTTSRWMGLKAELKCIKGGAGNIVKYAKKALTKQRG